MTFILLPTLLVAIYLYGFAAKVYMSEAAFGVKGTNSSLNPQGLLGLLGGASGIRTAFDEGMSLQDYYKSHDAVAEVDKSLNLRSIYRRSGTDVIQRLWGDATREELDDYFLRMTDVRFDQQDGVTRIRAWAFTPEDAQNVVEHMLEAGEGVINRYSTRSREDSVRYAQAAVTEAEKRVTNVLAQLSDFRRRASLLDPQQQGTAVLRMATDLQVQLLRTQAEIADSRLFLSEDSAYLKGLRSRASTLQDQYDKEYSQLAGNSGALASFMTEYEKIQLQRDFASRELEVTLASLETARLEAQRQQMYVIRVSNPVLPQEARYPQKGLVILGTFFSCMVIYGIGSLLVAGIRDHVL